MRLDSGTRLGPYEIIAPVGMGGMGKVYRARDTRLRRDIAIKVITAEHQPTEEQRRRFEREARAASRLAHPHICSVFDVGHEAGIDFLVIELLDGETLETRLERGPLPLDQCVNLGAKIASALAVAHERGVVHRDLKPANVMLTATGPKLLDFGLAKTLAKPPGDGADGGVASETAGLTGTGVVLGTVPYMSPEQIEGGAADARTDIFALGAVLYEMATGKPAFSAPNRAALIAAVLTSDPPPVSAARPGGPPALDRLIRTCLAKDPAERWHCARDVELQLRAMAGDRDERTPTAGRRVSASWLPWVLAAAVTLAALAWVRSTPAPTSSGSTVQFTVEPPAGGGILWTNETNPLALSPDGRQLAFIAFDSTGEGRIWLRPVSATGATPLPGTAGTRSLMWSPDGSSIAFFTSDRLQRIDLPGGAPMMITRIASRAGQSGTWGRRGDILFGGVQGEAIHRVPASGGTPEIILRPDTAAGEARVNWPWYLPDGERFLYWVKRTDGEGMLMESMPDGTRRRVMGLQSLAQYAEPGTLAFVREGTLLGQRFDAREGRVEGEPFAVADGVRYFLSTGVAAVATSAGGTLAFQKGRDLQRLVWLDRRGRELGPVGSTANYNRVSLSPDGTRLLASRQEPRLGSWDIWVIDFERGTETAITTSPHTETYGLWLPGGRSVVYSVGISGPPKLVRRDRAIVKSCGLG